MGDTEKTTDKSAKKDTKKRSFFGGVKHEFKQIKWPDRSRLVRESTAVLVVSIILAVIISLVDLGFKFGLDKLFSIGF
mgnify:CR=1 FL=1